MQCVAFRLKMDNSEIEQVFSTKFLAVIINENLIWGDHVHIPLNKISKNLGVIRKRSKSLPLDTLHTLYNTLVDPYLQYCTIAWATVNSSSVDKLFCMQKMAIRIITDNEWNSHTDNPFKNCNILKLADNSLQVGCFVYQVINGNIIFKINNC